VPSTPLIASNTCPSNVTSLLSTIELIVCLACEPLTTARDEMDEISGLEVATSTPLLRLPAEGFAGFLPAW
jgi:hypothetical protein